MTAREFIKEKIGDFECMLFAVESLADFLEEYRNHRPGAGRMAGITRERMYISGRISGLPLEEAQLEFDRAEGVLEALGYEVLNPIWGNGLDHSASWNDHMVADIKMLLSADSVFMLPGWASSKGARIEHEIARELEKPIYYGATYL